MSKTTTKNQKPAARLKPLVGRDFVNETQCEIPVEHSCRQVIENQVLASLDDKSKVAIIATEDDLVLLMDVLNASIRTDELNPRNQKRQRMVDDLRQLARAAFP